MNEGWHDDITKRGARRHYYKDGVSLCGKAKERHFFKRFDKEYAGYAYGCDCKICIKKKKEIINPKQPNP